MPDVPSGPSAPTSALDISSVSIKVPGVFDLSSIPATLSLSGSLINGYPFSTHDGTDEIVIYSGNAAECPRKFIIYVDLTGDMHGDNIEKQVEEEKDTEEEREESEKPKEDKNEEDRQNQQRQPIPYCTASRDSSSERHLQHLRVDAARSVFPWQPSTPAPLDQTSPGSPAELPVEAPTEAPVEASVESKPGSPGDLPDSEETDPPQHQVNDADLTHLSECSVIRAAPRSVIPAGLSNPEQHPKPSRPSGPPDLNTVSLYLWGSAMNDYPFSGRGQNDGFCIWTGPAVDCPRRFNISLELNQERKEDDDDTDNGPWYKVRRIDGAYDVKEERSVNICSMKPVWPWGPLPVSPYDTPEGSRRCSPVGSSSDHPEGGVGVSSPVGSPGGLTVESPASFWSQLRT